jgi:hypothetical protein
MGSRSKIATLPAPVRDKLDNLIVERAFGGYKDLADWLQQQGYSIGRNSVQRHGARLQQQIEARSINAEQTRALAAAGHAASEAADTLTAIIVQLIQQQVLSLLLQCPPPAELSDQSAASPGPTHPQDLKDEPGANAEPSENSDHTGSADSSSPPETPAATIAVADLVRLTRITTDLNRVINARPQRSSRAKPASEAKRAAAPQGKGLSEEAYHAIRNALLTRHSFEEYPGETAPESDQPSETTAEPAASATPPEKNPGEVSSDASQPGQTHLPPPGRNSRR